MLEGQGRGGDHDPAVVQERRHEVGQRLAGAGAGLDEQVGAVDHGVGDRLGHLDLAGALLAAQGVDGRGQHRHDRGRARSRVRSERSPENPSCRDRPSLGSLHRRAAPARPPVRPARAGSARAGRRGGRRSPGRRTGRGRHPGRSRSRSRTPRRNGRVSAAASPGSIRAPVLLTTRTTSAVPREQPDVDPALRPGQVVALGVLQQVADRPVEQLGVAGHGDRHQVEVPGALRLLFLADPVDGLGHQRHQVDRLVPGRLEPRLDPGQGEQRVDGPVRPVGLAQGHLGRAAGAPRRWRRGRPASRRARPAGWPAACAARATSSPPAVARTSNAVWIRSSSESKVSASSRSSSCGPPSDTRSSSACAEMARARLVIVCTGASTRPAKIHPTPTETAAVSSRPTPDHQSSPLRVLSTASMRAWNTVSPTVDPGSGVGPLSPGGGAAPLLPTK